MLNLQLILFAGCWGLLSSEEQVEWNNFLEYVSTYNKEYRDDSSELANRFKIFKVTHDWGCGYESERSTLGEPEASRVPQFIRRKYCIWSK